jgi:hypothetical protein
VEHLTLLVGKEAVALALIRHFGSLKGLARASFQGAAQEVASIQTTKIVFCPANRRLEAFGTMKADFLMRRIGSDARLPM